jgi:hypothetical protein
MTCNVASPLGGVTPIIPIILAGMAYPRDDNQVYAKGAVPEKHEGGKNFNSPFSATSATAALQNRRMTQS